MRRVFPFIALVVALFTGAPLAAQTDCDTFVGSVQAIWDDDGRNMTLTQPFKYIDPNCAEWAVPSQTRVNGASIPSIFWSLTGGPFSGTYRNASVVHDYFCVSKDRPWRDVHKMFYHAMIAGGTDRIQAKVMYMAVLVGGPKWKTVTYANHPPRLSPRPGDTSYTAVEEWNGDINSEEFERLRDQIEDGDLSLEEIDALAHDYWESGEPASYVIVE